MKQIIRYLVLVVCTLTLITWAISYRYTFIIGYTGVSHFDRVVVSNGMVSAIRTDKKMMGMKIINPDGFEIQTFDAYDNGFPQSPLGMSYSLVPNLGSYMIHVSFWLIGAALILLTALLWHAPLKAWWRGTSRKGFEVEVKDKG